VRVVMGQRGRTRIETRSSGPTSGRCHRLP